MFHFPALKNFGKPLQNLQKPSTSQLFPAFPKALPEPSSQPSPSLFPGYSTRTPSPIENFEKSMKNQCLPPFKNLDKTNRSNILYFPAILKLPAASRSLPGAFPGTSQSLPGVFQSLPKPYPPPLSLQKPLKTKTKMNVFYFPAILKPPAAFPEPPRASEASCSIMDASGASWNVLEASRPPNQ